LELPGRAAREIGAVDSRKLKSSNSAKGFEIAGAGGIEIGTRCSEIEIASAYIVAMTTGINLKFKI
jgi:hypothetical protein